jgi:P4 family phage/plasmid primase-like protien
MPQVPNRLRDDAFRFVLILSGEKRPFEENWQKFANYKFSENKIISHQGNLGILTGDGLIIFDCDCQQAENIARQLPETFVVGTSLSGEYRKKHFYFRCPREKKIILMDYNKHMGEIQAKGQQCIIPPSRHPSGINYEVIEDRPIASVTEAVLLNLVSPFMVEEKSGGSLAIKKEETDSLCAEIKKRVKIPQVLEKYGFDTSKNPTKCLWHESEGGKCFSFADDIWHCFHCGAGGSVFHLVMRHENVDFNKAKDILAVMAGLDEITESKKDSKYFEDSIFVPKFLADDIKKDFVFKTASGDGTMYVYINGFYRENAEEIIAEEVARRMGKLHKNIQTAEVIALVKALSYFRRESIQEDKNLINVQNGIYDLKNNKLLPHSPEHFFLTRVPVDFKDGATCPSILKFLHEILPEDDIPIVQELIGYCLYREYHIHKAFMLLGDGSNGKSTLLNLINAFLGFENTAGVSLQQFDKDRFAKSALFGKLANIYADLSPDALNRTGTFKMLTGGDVIFADKKFKNPFTFRNYAKLMFSANILPDTKDDTSAFFRRWVFLTFPNIFTDANKDANLLGKITTAEEMSGLFNWATDGLRRLLTKNTFTNSKSTEEIRDKYIRLSSPVRAFCMDRTENAEENIGKNELYSAFILYCQEKNLPTIPNNSFARKLKEILPTISEVWVQNDNQKFTRVWHGLRLKGNENNDDISTLDNYEEVVKSPESAKSTEKVTKSENKSTTGGYDRYGSTNSTSLTPMSFKANLRKEKFCKSPLNGNGLNYVEFRNPYRFESPDSVLQIRQEIIKSTENVTKSFAEIYKNIMEKFPISDNIFDQIFNELKTEGLIFSPTPEMYKKV